MKFQVMFKDPDTLTDAIRDAVKDELNAIDGLSNEERESLIDSRAEKIGEKVSKWFEHGEYVTIELDTEADTAVVVPRK